MEGRILWNEWDSEWKDGDCGMNGEVSEIVGSEWRLWDGSVSGRTEIVE